MAELRGELLGRVPVAEPVPEDAGEDEVAEFAVFRPAKSHEFEISRESDGTWVVRGESVERLFMRWDLENEEAQAHVERRLQRMGVIAALERAGFEPGDDVEIGGTVFELDPVLMPVAVVKLGSSIVATDTGELRLSVVGRICEEIAALHRSGVDVVIVTSGAIARGIHLLGLGTRPRVVEELQAASAVGQGRLYRTYDEYLRECGIQSAQVLLTFFDMSARTHYLNARRTLRTLVDWRIVPVINENDTTTTDEISFGDNDFLAAQVAVLVDASLLLLLTCTAGLFTADPRSDAVGAARRDRRPTPPSWRRCRSPPRRRRWARAGCARRSRRPRWRRPPAFRP